MLVRNEVSGVRSSWPHVGDELRLTVAGLGEGGAHGVERHAEAGDLVVASTTSMVVPGSWVRAMYSAACVRRSTGCRARRASHSAPEADTTMTNAAARDVIRAMPNSAS